MNDYAVDFVAIWVKTDSRHIFKFFPHSIFTDLLSKINSRICSYAIYENLNRICICKKKLNQIVLCFLFNWIFVDLYFPVECLLKITC